MNRAIVRYDGDTSFNIYGIEWHIDDHVHKIDQFCVPRNHFYWASESGTTECTEFSDSFSIYNPSMTIYIDYEWREENNGQRYNARVSPASVSNLSLNANIFSGLNHAQTTLRLYWDQNTYECTIWLTNTSSTHFCDDATLDLVTSNCTESAFAVGVTTKDDSGFVIESIGITDENGNVQTMDAAARCDEKGLSGLIVDFSTVWNEGEASIYVFNTTEIPLCFESTGYLTS